MLQNDLRVKPRFDGKGDAWANQHRDMLGPTFNMQDMDGYFGFTAFGANTGERIFLEYVPDDYENRYRAIREFGLVSMFDRKSSKEYALSKDNVVSFAFYLWLCRSVGKGQSIIPKFFFVVGSQEPPWEMIEIDINSGNSIKSKMLTSTNWKEIWHSLGLIELRREVSRLVYA